MNFKEFKDSRRMSRVSLGAGLPSDDESTVLPLDQGYTVSAAGIYCFEIAWEVANKVGGIYTVLRTKVPQMIEAYGDQFIMLGPHNASTVRTEVDEYVDLAKADICPTLKSTVISMKNRGVTIVVGRWLLDNAAPLVILFDIGSAAWQTDHWKHEFFQQTHIGIPPHDQESLNALILGFLSTWFLGEFHAQLSKEPARFAYGIPLFVAHFHEWQGGVGCILVRTRGLRIATVFTTHATLLGRYICAGGVDFYNRLATFDLDKEAGDRNIYHRYCIERAATNAAYVFTTVSEITALEAEHLLQRVPDFITPNGINLKKNAAIHEFQNLHAKSKEKIHDFIRGHFYGHLDFDFDKTLTFLIAGRYEYTNKGADVFLEALARLNYRLKVANSDMTVVAFLVFPARTNNYNVDSLKGQAVVKQLRNTVDDIKTDIGNRIFEEALRGEIVDGHDLMTPKDVIKLKRCILSSLRDNLPPIVTHNMYDDANDPILHRVRELRLFNTREERVKIVFHPEFLSPTSPLLPMDYEEFVRGQHLGVFPSYYEPWGYTPAECTVLGVPSISTNLSGFGCFMASHVADPTSYGIYIMDRRFRDLDASINQLTNYMFDYCKLSRRQRIILRNRTERLSPMLDWKNLGSEYYRAHLQALRSAYPDEMEGIDRDFLKNAGGYMQPYRYIPRTYSAATSPASSRVPSEAGDIAGDSDAEDDVDPRVYGDEEFINFVSRKDGVPEGVDDGQDFVTDGTPVAQAEKDAAETGIYCSSKGDSVYCDVDKDSLLSGVARLNINSDDVEEKAKDNDKAQSLEKVKVGLPSQNPKSQSNRKN